MTVSSTVYKADSTGNGVTTEFTIPFDLQDESQVLVTKVSAAGVETVLVLNTDYTVSGVGTASRKITLTSALPTGERVIRSPNISLTQSVDYVEGDDFPAETHEAAIDKLTLICQQLQEQLNRTVKLDISDAVDIDALITNVQTVAENLTNLNIVAGIDTEITTVAGIESAVSTLAAISSEISAVSAVSADVADVAAIDTDVTAVAAISAAISTLNGIAADISTVAGVSGDVTTVAGVAADVTTVAGLETEILAVPGQAQAAADSAAAAATFDPALYLAKAGGTMTGNLTAPALISSASKSDTPMSDLFIRDANSLFGMRHSLANDLCIDVHNSGSATNALKVNQEGFILKPNHPVFSVDGAPVYSAHTTMVFGNAKVNQGSNYNAATGVFTAPVTGKYYFEVYCLIDTSAATSTYATLNFVINGSGVNPLMHSAVNYARSYEPLSFSDVVSLAEGDTLSVNLGLYNGATSPGSPYNSFTGFLIG